MNYRMSVSLLFVNNFAPMNSLYLFFVYLDAMLREATKKRYFLSGPTTEALPPYRA